MLKYDIFASLGKIKPDLAIEGNMVNTMTGDIQYTCAAIYKGKIVGFGDYDIRPKIKCDHFCPGLIDGHIHIESSMLSPPVFSRLAASRGTTAIIADPHEIASVSGIDGVLKFIEESQKSIIKIYFMAPSSVPASPLEMPEGAIRYNDLIRLSGNPKVLGLGEVMNVKGLLQCRKDVIDKLSLYKLKDGHAPGLKSHELDAYICSGIDSDHESETIDEGLEKLRKGMWLMIREGSCAKNLNELLMIVNRVKDTGRMLFATDDRDALTIFKEGHMDHIVRSAIQMGMDPVNAIQMATIHTATRFGLDMGKIMPGMPADIVLLDDLRSFKIKDVMINGVSYRTFPPPFYMNIYKRDNTVHVPKIYRDEIAIWCTNYKAIKAIGIRENSIYTDTVKVEIEGQYGLLRPSLDYDILKICCIRRYPGEKMVSSAFVRGFGIKRGAVAQTISHDSHNIISIGVSDHDILTAVNRLMDIKGGIVVADKGNIIAELPLPYGGLMSDDSPENVAEKLEIINDTLHKMGSVLLDPIIRMAFLGLTVVPELKLSCMGLVDVNSQKIVSMFYDG
jgi:adenine deaminase